MAAPEPAPVAKPATTHKEIIEQAGLSHPKESVQFLTYMKDHVEKVEAHGSRISKISKIFALTAGVALAYQAMSYFSQNAA